MGDGEVGVVEMLFKSPVLLRISQCVLVFVVLNQSLTFRESPASGDEQGASRPLRRFPERRLIQQKRPLFFAAKGATTC